MRLRVARRRLRPSSSLGGCGPATPTRSAAQRRPLTAPPARARRRRPATPTPTPTPTADAGAGAGELAAIGHHRAEPEPDLARRHEGRGAEFAPLARRAGRDQAALLPARSRLAVARAGRRQARLRRLHRRAACATTSRAAPTPRCATSSGARGAPARGRLGDARRAARDAGMGGAAAGGCERDETHAALAAARATWPTTGASSGGPRRGARSGRGTALLEPVERAQPPVLHLAAAAGVRRDRAVGRRRALCGDGACPAGGARRGARRPAARAGRAGGAGRAAADDDLGLGVRRATSRRTSPADRRSGRSTATSAAATSPTTSSARWRARAARFPRSGSPRPGRRAPQRRGAADLARAQLRACGRLHRRLGAGTATRA